MTTASASDAPKAEGRNGRDAGGRDAGGRDARGRDAGGRDAGGRDAGGRDAGGRADFLQAIIIAKAVIFCGRAVAIALLNDKEC